MATRGRRSSRPRQWQLKVRTAIPVWLGCLPRQTWFGSESGGRAVLGARDGRQRSPGCKDGRTADDLACARSQPSDEQVAVRVRPSRPPERGG